MRNGDFGVEVIPARGARTRELESGQVLARPGTVYALRLRNFGPLACVVQVEIDGRSVTSGGLVLKPWSVTNLERPIHETENGRFTVFAEGDEAVFGPDGGRDNDKLGLIHASFRRELPNTRSSWSIDDSDEGRPLPMPDISYMRSRGPGRIPQIDALMSPSPVDEFSVREGPAVERAAGTGLTGHSDQQFVPMSVGPLEREATVIQLRLVIGSDEAIAEAPATSHDDVAPARPAARP